MMQFKLMSTLLLTCIIFFSQLSYANMPPKPQKCPSVADIRSVGILVVQPNGKNTWLAGVLSNKYNTNDVWMFVLGEIKASNEAEAREKATASLSSLSFIQGPIAVAQYQVWACLYNTAQGYRAITITPPLNLTHSLTMI